MNKIYGIKYIPENRIIYIGQTIQSGNRRWYEHIRQAKISEKTDKLHTFLKQNDITQFEFIILEELDCTKQELNDLEEYYISMFDTYNNGYNSLPRSNCINLNTHGSQVVWYDNNKLYKGLFNTITAAEKASGINAINISHCCNHLQTKTSKGWFRFINDTTSLEESYRSGTSLEVNKLDPFTLEVLKTYPSLQQAELTENIAPGYLSAVCNGKRYSAKGYIYQYKDENKRIPYSGSRKVKSGIAQVDPNTKIVLNKFLTCEDAAKILKVNQDTITRARHNGMRKSIGYIWIDAFDYNDLLLKGEIFENENTRRNY